jgi:hypothetical protein
MTKSPKKQIVHLGLISGKKNAPKLKFLLIYPKKGLKNTPKTAQNKRKHHFRDATKMVVKTAFFGGFFMPGSGPPGKAKF